MHYVDRNNMLIYHYAEGCIEVSETFVILHNMFLKCFLVWVFCPGHSTSNMSFKPTCSNYIKSVMFLIKVYALFCAGTLIYLLQKVRK